MNEINVITGGAGCIGSELAGALLQQGKHVRVVDNLSTGRIEHIQEFQSNPNFKFFNNDILCLTLLDEALSGGVDMVWHLAAKTDIKFTDHYDFEADVRENLLATWGLLRVMRSQRVKKLAFASSAAVYGDRVVIDEEMVLEPISLYGATKLSCETVIRAMALRAGFQAWMFRYCSIVSPKARKSGNMVIPDLIHKLQKDPARLEILGDGNQTKPSLLVTECVDAMLHIVGNCKDQVSIHNIGAPDAVSVTRQAELICESMGVQPKFHYTGGTGGWPGDVPSFNMCVNKLAQLGWRAKRTSEESVKEAIKGLLESGE